jgi:hypothetical protein
LRASNSVSRPRLGCATSQNARLAHGGEPGQVEHLAHFSVGVDTLHGVESSDDDGKAEAAGARCSSYGNATVGRSL